MLNMPAQGADCRTGALSKHRDQSQFIIASVFALRVICLSFLSGIIFFTVDKALAAEYTWESIPLRNIKQKDSGLKGGEGLQMVMSIAYAPSKPDIVYMGVDTTAVWKSVDCGRSWQPKFNGFLAMGAVSLGVDPVNHDIVYAAGIVGKKENNSKNLPYLGRGIYVSKDGGESWNLKKRTVFFKKNSRGNLFAFDSRYVSGRKTMVIYAGTDHDGLLRSNDAGETWESVGLRNVVITDIEEIPNGKGEFLIATEQGLHVLSSGRISKKETNLPAFARTISMCRDKPRIVYAALGKKGIYKSIDNGSFFSPLHLSLPNIEFNDVSVSPVNCDYVYVRGHMTSLGPFYSHDGGKTWHYPKNTNLDSFVDKQGFWFSSPFAVHPDNENEALHVSNGRARIIKTIDGGVNWKYSNFGYTGGRMIDVEFMSDKSMIFSLTDRGLWFTDDAGSTFKDLDIKRIFGGRSSSAVSVSGDIIIASVGKWKKKALLASYNKGKNWRAFKNLKGRNWFIDFHPMKNNIIYAGQYKSLDGGLSWHVLKYNVMDMFLQNGDIVYSVIGDSKSTCRVIKSLDGGTAWAQIGDELPVPPKSVNDLVVDPTDQNRIYIATNTGLWLFENGLQWVFRGQKHGIENDAFGKNYIMCIAVDPKNSDIVYLGKRAPGNGRSNGIFRSIDRGITWVEFNHNLAPGVTIWSIQISPFDSSVFIGTSFGTFRLKKSIKQ